MKNRNILIVFLVVLVGVLLYMQLGSKSTMMQESEIEEESFMSEDGQADIKENGNTLVAQLEDVSGGESSGMGYILREDGRLTHLVEANLPDPEEGYSYEGWLVSREDGLQFFSTGVMNKVEGKYVLNYSSQVPYEGYNEVVITLESVIDETPEEHIIEGVAN